MEDCECVCEEGVGGNMRGDCGGVVADDFLLKILEMKIFIKIKVKLLFTI